MCTVKVLELLAKKSYMYTLSCLLWEEVHMSYKISREKLSNSHIAEGFTWL